MLCNLNGQIFKIHRKSCKKKKIKPGPLRTMRCIHSARGNAGLQNLLFSMSLEDPQACDRALNQMEDFIQSGKEPDEEKLLEFIENLAINELIQILTPGEKELVRASTLFTVPVPVAVVELIAEAIGTKGKDSPGDRIFALGLWEPYEDLVEPDEAAFSLNALARSQAGILNEEESARFAHMVWGETEGTKRPYSADLELARLALMAEDTTVLAATAQRAVRGLKEKFLHREAAALAIAAIAALDNEDVEASPGLLRVACERCEQIGDMEKARSFIARALEIFKSAQENGENVDRGDYVHALAIHARLLVKDGFPDNARKTFEKVRDIYEELGDRRSRAVTLGDIARIRVDKGEVDEALKLHEERLKNNHELGNLDGVAAALFDIAQIELQRQSYQEGYDHLNESYEIFLKIGRLDGISFVGMDLGQLLCQAGHKEQGREILQRSFEGFMKLGQAALAQRVQEMIRECES